MAALDPAPSQAFGPVVLAVSPTLTVAGAAPDLHRLPNSPPISGWHLGWSEYQPHIRPQAQNRSRRPQMRP